MATTSVKKLRSVHFEDEKDINFNKLPMVLIPRRSAEYALNKTTTQPIASLKTMSTVLNSVETPAKLTTRRSRKDAMDTTADDELPRKTRQRVRSQSRRDKRRTTRPSHKSRFPDESRSEAKIVPSTSYQKQDSVEEIMQNLRDMKMDDDKSDCSAKSNVSEISDMMVGELRMDAKKKSNTSWKPKVLSSGAQTLPPKKSRNLRKKASKNVDESDNFSPRKTRQLTKRRSRKDEPMDQQSSNLMLPRAGIRRLASTKSEVFKEVEIWSGAIEFIGSQCQATAVTFQVGQTPVTKIGPHLPKNFHVLGRIDPIQVFNYLEKVNQCESVDMSFVYFYSEDPCSYSVISQFLETWNRVAVIKTGTNKQVKDIYISPLSVLRMVMPADLIPVELQKLIDKKSIADSLQDNDEFIGYQLFGIIVELKKGTKRSREDDSLPNDFNGAVGVSSCESSNKKKRLSAVRKVKTENENVGECSKHGALHPAVSVFEGKYDTN